MFEKKQNKQKKTVYHIGVHIVKSNHTFQRLQLESTGVVKYCCCVELQDNLIFQNAFLKNVVFTAMHSLCYELYSSLELSLCKIYLYHIGVYIPRD